LSSASRWRGAAATFFCCVSVGAAGFSMSWVGIVGRRRLGDRPLHLSGAFALRSFFLANAALAGRGHLV
jgi:hypothetical protein